MYNPDIRILNNHLLGSVKEGLESDRFPLELRGKKIFTIGFLDTHILFIIQELKQKLPNSLEKMHRC